MPLPRLRNVDAFPIEHNGEKYICLRDPENLIEESVLLSPPAFIIASLLDGKNNVIQIQENFQKLTKGAKVAEEEINKLIYQLDEKGLLFTEKYKELKDKVESDFLGLRERPSFLSGKSYPESEPELSKMLNKYMDNARFELDGIKNSSVNGIISPHIDYTRGGACYGFAYSALRQAARDFDTFIILGVAHVSPPVPYVLTSKSFQTPFGTVETDSDIISFIAERTDYNLFEHEATHRGEHSIEFQAVFLKHVMERPFKIIPILCSSFEVMCVNDPQTNAHIRTFIDALQKAMNRYTDRKFFILSGADLAHVGPRFGDNIQVDDSLIGWMKGEDKKSLNKIEEVDALGFYKSVIEDGNKRKVCGLSSVYTALKLLEGNRGKILNYNYSPDPAGGIVSYASALLYK